MIEVQTINVRLAEIDAPERRQPFGERSRQYLSALCFLQSAAVRTVGRDRYGRTIARVACSGSDASASLVRAGMAWAYTKYLKDAEIGALEAEARAERVGLWADRSPVPPWMWRGRKERSPP